MSNQVSLTNKAINVVTQGRGLRGYAVEIRVNSGYIQTKYEYETKWTNLIPLSALIGPQGLASYIHIKWHAEGSDILLDTPDAYIGIYADNTEADSTIYYDYQWYKTKGEKGDPAPNTIWQYSADGTTWTTVATGAVYERQSGDNGVTWSEAHEYPGVAALVLKANVTDVNDALVLKAPLASPTFTGDVIVPDQTAGNNSTKAANTKYVDAGLGLKANTTDVDDALALKADSADVADALALILELENQNTLAEAILQENLLINNIYDRLEGGIYAAI